MTFVSSLIVDALRESNTIPLGRAPSDAQNTEALRLLNGLFKAAFGADFGYILNDFVLVDTATITNPMGFLEDAVAWSAPPNVRVLCELASATTLTLDPMPVDGARLSIVDLSNGFSTHTLTVNAGARLIQAVAGGAGTQQIALTTAGFAGQWFYRADIGTWTLIPVALALTDVFPMPEHFDEYFYIMLASRLNPRYGRMLDDQSKSRLAQMQVQIERCYGQSHLRQVPAPPTSTQAGFAGE